VATGIGALAALAPAIALGVFLVWVVILAVFRYVSLASITASVALPIAVYTVGPSTVRLFSAIVAAVIVFRHSENIRRLLAGTESRVGRHV
jgi:glycerol-3-phosphate acyltransferase PlsY